MNAEFVTGEPIVTLGAVNGFLIECIGFEVIKQIHALELFGEGGKPTGPVALLRPFVDKPRTFSFYFYLGRRPIETADGGLKPPCATHVIYVASECLAPFHVPQGMNAVFVAGIEAKQEQPTVLVRVKLGE